MSEKKAKQEKQVQLTLPETLKMLDKIQADTINLMSLYHQNVKNLVNQLLETLETKNRIIKP